ncbi:MAG: 2-C-methyl-D-erythritol 4-phosphate cytidylyltransferase [Jatrophihabitans sp.]|uniref:2-C-methyl-D-erythritol 4-phosphate cytidylyltransferase n=1 Tax=Jatrophihabitans sp. TaxID=1932789 RepID=UPI003F7E390C
MTVAAIVVAAGSGQRLGASVPKAFVEIAGRTLLEHAVEPFLGLPLVVVAPAALVDSTAALVPRAAVVPGGTTRQESVARGLDAVPRESRFVLVHDAARAFTPPDVITRVLDALHAGADAVIPALPVSDTIKQVRDGVVVATPDRAGLVAVQTPQGFRRDVLVAAHSGAAADSATDDAALVEAQGGRVVVVEGAVEAFKITILDDLRRAEALLAARS